MTIAVISSFGAMVTAIAVAQSTATSDIGSASTSQAKADAVNSSISTINITIWYISSGVHSTFGPYTQILSPLRIDDSTGVTDNIVLSNSLSVASTFNSATQLNSDR